jgi:rRNA maturation RNase YbeY
LRNSAGTEGRLEVVSAVRGAPGGVAVRRWLSRLLSGTGAPAARVSVLLCGDRRMKSLNRRFRGVDAPTDVLSFRPSPDPPRPSRRIPAGGFLGDIVVDVSYAARQARRRGHGLEREIQILLAHGLLHLLGYDHEKDDGQMFRLQARRVRRAFGPGPDGVPGEAGEA